MQPIQLLVIAGLLASSVRSQVNPFVFFPQDPERQVVTCTSFVGRPNTNQAAEALLEMRPEDFRGVADANGIARIFGMYHWVADERLSTIETYDLVVRSAAASGPGPDMTVGGELLRIVGLTTPPSTVTARGTWILSDGFGITGGLILHSPSQSVTLDRTYFGVDLPARPQWPATDGHALFRADLVNAGTGALLGENHRAGVPNPTWAGRHTLPPYSTPWTYILGPLVTSPNLHVGGIDPTSSRLGATGANLSMNGLWPDIGGSPRSDGVMVRMTDNLAPFGLCGLAASIGFQAPYFEIGLVGILIGHSHIGSPLAPPHQLGVGVLANGVHEWSIALPGTVPVALVGMEVVFQGVVWDTNINLAEWTNAQAVHL